MSAKPLFFNGISRVTFVLLFFLLVGRASAASMLTPRDRATVIVARHLLTAIGTPALDAAAKDRSLRSDAYWRSVFEGAKAPSLYDAIAGDLRRAMADVPLVDGRPAEPAVFARAVLRGLGPLPLRPLEDAPEIERQAILGFAQKELSDFSREALARSDGAELAAAAAAAKAKTVFHSTVISDAFFRLGQLLADDDQARVDLLDTKDRLNEYLHPYGLHLVIDAPDLKLGRVNLASYVVLTQHAFNILGKPFVVYQTRPSVASHSTAALGHAELDAGYMFIFANHVEQETAAGLAFARGAGMASLWGDDGAPLGGTAPGAVAEIEKLVRARLKEGTGLDDARYRALLINTIGRHEGFHMYIQPAIAAALRTGKISRLDSAQRHENGAYLYQLEAGDPRFVHMDLLMLLLVATSKSDAFPDNIRGARAALGDLQAYVKDIWFWDAVTQKPLPNGLVRLFEATPEVIQKAASQARWDYEVGLRN